MKVSVVIPFYNRPEALRACLASVMNQTVPAHEILLADDHSPEDITWVAKEFPSVQVLRLPQNRGCNGARHYAMERAMGTHVATLDADDVWYPEKLEKQAAFVKQTGDPRGIYCHQQLVVEDGGASIRPTDGPLPGESTSEYIYVRNGFIQSNVLLMERSLYTAISFVSEGVWAGDFEIVMRAGPFKSPIYLQKEVLSQWNCTSDPKRLSNNKAFGLSIFDRDFLPRQAIYFTPKAKAAFRGRWLAPRLMKQGQYQDAAQLLGRAVQAKALSPMAALKIVLMGAIPRQFTAAASWYSYLRHGRTKVPQLVQR